MLRKGAINLEWWITIGDDIAGKKTHDHDGDGDDDDGDNNDDDGNDDDDDVDDDNNDDDDDGNDDDDDDDSNDDDKCQPLDSSGCGCSLCSSLCDLIK